MCLGGKGTLVNLVTSDHNSVTVLCRVVVLREGSRLVENMRGDQSKGGERQSVLRYVKVCRAKS